MQAEFRPTTVEELFGQDHLKGILIKWLNNPTEIPKSILLHGPYGCAKTSIARMLAAKLTTNPTDIHEMNAAAARGIDDVRDIADSTSFSGFGGNKVYIIDELHSMTPAAQSALLKVIEEPKEGVYFILCTTDYAKLLDTIRSRCTKLEVRLLSEQASFELMKMLDSSLSEEMMFNIYLSSGGHARDIVKSVAIGKSHPQVITQTVANINNAHATIAAWYKGDTCDPWSILSADESALRMLCDYVCDTPAILGNYFTKDNYHQLLQNRAHSLVYLITQKHRYIHMISLRY